MFHHYQQQSHFGSLPLASLAEPGTDKIVLQMRDSGNDSDHLVLRHNPGAGIAYFMLYQEHGFNGEILHGPLLSPDKPRLAGWKVKSRELKFYFNTDCPRNKADPCEWRFEYDGGSFSSAFGSARGHWIKWSMADESRDRKETRFTLRGTDTDDDQRRDVCKVVMQSYYEGTFEIPLWAVETRQQLDEMVMVAVATMDTHRDDLSE